MRAIGVVVEPNQGKPKAHCVVMDVDWGSQQAPQSVEGFSVQPPAGLSLAQGVGFLNRQFRARCNDLGTDIVWIWTAEGNSRQTVGSDGGRTRLAAEGALAAAATEAQRTVEFVTAPTVSAATGMTKEDVVAAAASLTGVATQKAAQAAGAAFGALHSLRP